MHLPRCKYVYVDVCVCLQALIYLFVGFHTNDLVLIYVFLYSFIYLFTYNFHITFHSLIL